MNQPKRQMTDAEALPIAERIADWLLRPDNSIMHVALAHGVENPNHHANVARLFGFNTPPFHPAQARELATAIQRGDRESLINFWFRIVIYWKKEEVGEFWNVVDNLKPNVRSLFESGVKSIHLKTGPRSRVPTHDYPKLARLGDNLAPVILILLQEQAAKTKRTMKEILEFRENDFPEESAFLLRHLLRLESVLKNKALLKRAKKLPTRARLIADAMAGSEYDLEPRTSVERTREGRRAFHQSAS